MDITIRKSKECNGCNAETVIELINTDHANEDFIERMVERLYRDGDELERPIQSAAPRNGSYQLRRVVSGGIDPTILKKAIAENRLDEFISPFDEIDIPLDDGETITVVCGYSDKCKARFVFKDCWDRHEMSNEITSNMNYHDSLSRRFILKNIYPRLHQEWIDIIKPREIEERVGGKVLKYADSMWLLSATDVFGSPVWKRWPDEPDSFQLPIFQKERDRVKEIDDDGTCNWWLRSVNAANTKVFCYVCRNGTVNYDSAYLQLGLALGFDI